MRTMTPKTLRILIAVRDLNDSITPKETTTRQIASKCGYIAAFPIYNELADLVDRGFVEKVGKKYSGDVYSVLTDKGRNYLRLFGH